jgi:hypothetical protein
LRSYGKRLCIYELDYRRIILWGIRLNSGRGDLALHKKLQNLMEHASYHDKAFFTPLEVDTDDSDKGVPSSVRE